MSGTGKTVLITGGSGFVAAHVLNSFLSRGYNVRTTVRNDASAEKVKKSHSKYISQLSFAIVKDVADPGAHDEAVKGVDGVIHTASPFQIKVEDNERDLLIPAIHGTESVLTSIQKFNPSVKRVVITSSFASVADVDKGARPGYTYTEADWNPATYDYAKNSNGVVAYCASKALAEKAAFEFVEKNKPNFAITTVCPPMVWGPNADSADLNHLGTSSEQIYNFINGSMKEVPATGFFAFADARDLGEAHVLAYEKEEAAGQRYLITSGNYTFQQIADIIREDFPEKRSVVPVGNPGEKFPDVYKLDNSKAQRQLGITFTELRTTINDQVKQFIALEKAAGKA
jgi:nucleoside-diphosphate-sugar epimerase